MLPRIAYLITSKPRSLIIRSGIPVPSGSLVLAAKERGIPVLFSANCFAVRYPVGHSRERSFRRFRFPDPQLFDGIDAALDPSGFVSASRYGEYQWEVDAYLDLVASHPWTWWAGMDYCCEPEIAGDRPLRLLRMAETVALYEQCLIGARRRGLTAPMPVLQGWSVDDYLQTVEWFALSEWPALVGVGSVCRRQVHGPNGILEIVHALDRVLPPHTRLHLFGVKSEALSLLAGVHRVASTDSMAWDFAARVERRTSRDTTFRIGCLDRWLARQHRRLTVDSIDTQFQAPLLMGPHGTTNEQELVQEAVALKYADLILSRNMDYRAAIWHSRRDAADAVAVSRRHGRSKKLFTDLDEILPGLGELIDRLRTTPTHRSPDVTTFVDVHRSQTPTLAA